MEAIRIAFTLDREKRRATDTEQAILKQYSGFGGIKCILNPAEKESDKSYWTKTDMELFPMVADLHRLIRENSHDEKEYKRYFNSIKSSVLTAFYTPPEAIKALSETLKENGIIPSNFLEPSAGNGAFIDAFRETFPQNKTVGFEKDLLTGKVLSHLHPNDRVHITGFEEIEKRPDNQFDVIASNIPFGDTSVFDMSFSKSNDQTKRQATQKVHNYFFLKGVETLREGGLLGFITSQGVMNSQQNKPVREWLMNNTNLVSAIRLPNNLMSDNAGTEVGSDLIILQKNSNKTLLTAEEQAFTESRTLSNGINTNGYFRDTSRIVQTESFVDKDLYGSPGMIYLHKGGVQGMAADMKAMLSEDFSKNLNKELYLDNTVSPRQQQQEPSHEELEEIDAAVEAVRKGKWNEFTASRPYINGNTEKPQTTPEERHQQPKPAPNLEQHPVMSLYDLFGFSEEERKQLNTNKRRKKKPASKQEKPKQLNLFEQPASVKLSAKTPEIEKKQEIADMTLPRPYSGILQEHHKQGSLVAEQNGQIGFLKERYRYDAVFKSLELNPLQEQKAKLYIEIRDTYHSLYNYEAKEQKENKDLRQSLNIHYDTFVKSYGNLNDRKNLDLIKMDAGGREILSLEHSDNGKLVKADIFNTVGNIFSGQIVGESAKNLSERFGKILQKRQSISINRQDTSTSISTQLDSLIPASKISNLTQGMFVGSVSDNFGERIEQKIFHAEIVVDNDKVAAETKAFQPIPIIADFVDEAGKDIMQQIIEDNYNQIKADVKEIVANELKNRNIKKIQT